MNFKLTELIQPLIIRRKHFSEAEVVVYVVCMGGSVLMIVLVLWFFGPDNVRSRTEVGVASIMVLVSVLALVNGIWHAYHTDRRRRAVIYILCCYFSLDFLFAAGYFLLYHSDPSAFHFSSGIQQGRIVKQFDGTMESVVVLNKTLGALVTLHSFPEQVVGADFEEPAFGERRRQFSHAGTAVSMSQSIIPFNEFTSVSYTVTIAGGNLSDAVELEAGGQKQFFVTVAGHEQVIGVRDTGVSPITLYYSDSSPAFYGAIENLMDGIKLERDRLLADLNKNVRGEGRWRLLDFLYLSTVTLTTLGFGDVVPNNGVARAAIMCESVAGVVLLAFALVMFRPLGRSALD